MIYTIPIQSLSDIITNSSSEVFVCKATCEDSLEIITDLLREAFDLYKRALEHAHPDEPIYCAGESLEDIMEIDVADSDYQDSSCGYSYQKGDILIWSTSDNSIPYPIMQFIEDLFPYNLVKRCHLG